MTHADDTIRPAQRADLAARIARAAEFRDAADGRTAAAQRRRERLFVEEARMEAAWRVEKVKREARERVVGWKGRAVKAKGGKGRHGS